MKDSLFFSYAFSGIAVALALFLRFGAPWLFNHLEKKRLVKAGMGDIDEMNGRTFEQYLEALFERLGYQVERTRYVGDYGADLVIRKDGVKTIVQAKRWKKTVGVKAIQEVVAAKAMYGCTEAMVITNSFYSNQAIELAHVNEVVLWNRKDLLDAMLAVTRDGQSLTRTPDPLTESTSVPMSVPQSTQLRSRHIPAAIRNDAGISYTCALCDKQISDAAARYCLSRRQQFHGQVYCFTHQRTVAARK